MSAPVFRCPPLNRDGRTLGVDLVAQHDPQPNPELPRGSDPRPGEAVLLLLAPAEALQIRAEAHGVQRGFTTKIGRV